MTEERIHQIEKELSSEDLFDEYVHVYDLLQELLLEVKRLHKVE